MVHDAIYAFLNLLVYVCFWESPRRNNSVTIDIIFILWYLVVNKTELKGDPSNVHYSDFLDMSTLWRIAKRYIQIFWNTKHNFLLFGKLYI